MDADGLRVRIAGPHVVRHASGGSRRRLSGGTRPPEGPCEPAVSSPAVAIPEPRVIDMIRSGRVTPTAVLTQQEPLVDAITAYQEFDRRRAGWVKVELKPAAARKGHTSGYLRNRVLGFESRRVHCYLSCRTSSARSRGCLRTTEWTTAARSRCILAHRS